VFSLFWELFGNLTPGLGEVSSARISEYLATGFYQEAILLSRKVVLFGYLLAGSVGSFWLVASTGIAKTLISDNSLRELVMDSSGLLSLAMAARIFSQLYWHLASAQGRFGLATFSSLATKWLFILPVSLLFVAAIQLDLKFILLVVSAGHAGKAFILGYKVFGTDWDALSRSIRERREDAFDEQQEQYNDGDDDDDDDDDDSSSDDNNENDDSEGSSDDATERAPVDPDDNSDVDSFTPKTQDITWHETETVVTGSELQDFEDGDVSEEDRFSAATFV
jgi:hypothetical protein